MRAATSVVICLAIGSTSFQFTSQLRADTSKPAKSAASKTEERESTRRKPLPAYYGQIGVNDEQRQQLYSIQDSYEVKLEKLREELKALIAERDAKLEAVLTPGQKSRLKELREAARRKAAERGSQTAEK